MGLRVLSVSGRPSLLGDVASKRAPPGVLFIVVLRHLLISDWLILAASLNPRVLIAMTAYNEADRISNFILELNVELKGIELSFFVVDDASSDSTFDSLITLSSTGINLSVQQNLVNLGHGPSTIIALAFAVNQHPDCILLIDGDGHFDCLDVRKILTYFLENNYDIVEGVRMHRADPLFRKIVSNITKLLVASKSGTWPADANTPLRLYTSAAAKLMLAYIPKNSLIPNLHVSSLTRTLPISFQEFQIKPFTRSTNLEQSDVSKHQSGSTWGQNNNILPNQKFIKFCVNASFEWLKAYRTD